MRHVQLVVLAAILLVLSVIAYDLHRLVVLLPQTSLTYQLTKYGEALAKETPEQHRERIRRESKAFDDAVRDALEVSSPAPRAASDKAAPRNPRTGPPPTRDNQ